MNSFKLKKAIPALVLAVVITGGLLTYNLMPNNGEGRLPTGDRTAGDAGLGREDMIMELKNQFQIDNRHYILMTDEQIAEFKLPAIDKQSNIGEKLTSITTSVGSSLIGSEVYKFIPAGGEAIVAVKKDHEYKLFKFFAFDSYNNNQDEDSNTYLKLYGINSAADIAKIQFIGRSEQSKINGVLDIKSEITDITKITEFYNFYSVMKNSSDKYFKKLFKTKTSQSTPSKKTEIAPDYGFTTDEKPADNTTIGEPQYAEDAIDLPPVKSSRDIGSSTIDGAGESSASKGNAGNVLFNSVAIRIFNQSGVYFEAEYYPNISFISRHEVNEAFAAFLKDYIASSGT